MKLNELRRVWREELVAKSHLEEQKMLSALKKESASLDKKIRRRDWLEIGTSVFLFFVWLWQAYLVPGLVAKAGLVILMGASIYIPWRLLQAREPGTPVDASLEVVLEHEIRKTRKQIELLGNVTRWYLAPPAVGMLVFFLGVILSLPGEIPLWIRVPGFLVPAAFMLAVFAGVRWMNHRAVRVHLEPRLRKLQEQLARLEEQPQEAYPTNRH